MNAQLLRWVHLIGFNAVPGALLQTGRWVDQKAGGLK